MTRQVISVIIPAHDEAAVIGRLLRSLLDGARPGELDVVVVANGCSDDTAQVAAGFGEPVRVVSTPLPSKYQALRLGDEHAAGFPRLYVDADVVIGAADARVLAQALDEPGVAAVAPARDLALGQSSLVVRWYYDYWQRLPGVRDGLYGRGVIGVTEAGHRRLVAIGEVMGDDLAASIAFPPAQRRVAAAASAVIYPPKTVGDLLRRRVRSLTSTAQLSAAGETRTSGGDLLRIVARNPLLAPKLAAFLGVTMMARAKARKPIRSGDYTTWLRDESSRVG